MERSLPSVDYRVVQQIQSSPQMMGEQGSGFMSQYGGPSGYVELDSDPTLGLVYQALEQGALTEELPVWTGLPTKDINSALVRLAQLKVIEPMDPVREVTL